MNAEKYSQSNEKEDSRVKSLSLCYIIESNESENSCQLIQFTAMRSIRSIRSINDKYIDYVPFSVLMQVLFSLLFCVLLFIAACSLPD